MAEERSSGIRLNKFVAQCGIASRRKAAELVKNGHIIVNGRVEDNPAYLVQNRDKVQYRGKQLKPQSTSVYLLMNKPKDTITTVNDEKDRKTVIDLIKHKIPQRVYPVGRLDRNTTGLLLLTNDGDLAQKLAHPKYKVQKIYHVKLDQKVSESDLEKIRAGLVLEDGPVQVDGIEYVQGKSKAEVGLEIHIGKNRIVRRIFEHLGYKVIKLDRVYYGGLTKKDLPRGRFRHLTKQEVIMLKHFI